MPLELLFETSLARAMKNLETYHSQGFLLVNLFGDVPPERIRKSVFFQPAVFRPGLSNPSSFSDQSNKGHKRDINGQELNLFHHYFDQKALKKVSSNHFKFPILLFLSLALANRDTMVWYHDFYGRCCDTLPFSLRPLHSMEIEHWFLQINSIFFMDHIS